MPRLSAIRPAAPSAHAARDRHDASCGSIASGTVALGGRKSVACHLYDETEPAESPRSQEPVLHLSSRSDESRSRVLRCLEALARHACSRACTRATISRRSRSSSTFDIRKGDTFAIGERIRFAARSAMARMVVGLLPPVRRRGWIAGVSMTDRLGSGDTAQAAPPHPDDFPGPLRVA